MDRAQWIVAGGVLAVAGLAGWWFGDAPQPPPRLPLTVSSAAGTITVHVAGAVAAPGLVEIDSDSRVADAVSAAGGLLSTADPSGLNLAAPIVDGQQVIVRELGEAVTQHQEGRVHVNSATASELEQISGVGPVLAARIVDYRETNGPFVTVERSR